MVGKLTLVEIESRSTSIFKSANKELEHTVPPGGQATWEWDSTDGGEKHRATPLGRRGK